MPNVITFFANLQPGMSEAEACPAVTSSMTLRSWAAVSRAIVDTGFKGFMAHEFIPLRDPLASLKEAVVLCDI